MVEEADGTVDIDNGFVATDTTPKITWKTRRKMSFICLWSFLIASFVLIFGLLFLNIPDKRLEELVNIYSYFVMGCMSVVLAYFGFTTLPFIGRGK